VFAHARAEQRIVVTYDSDFGEIVGLSLGTSVILLRLRSVRLAHSEHRIEAALIEAARALLTGAVVLVEDARIRIRIRLWPQENLD
jgi:predicted nuclease of predicted toxin-antitoxin system